MLFSVNDCFYPLEIEFCMPNKMCKKLNKSLLHESFMFKSLHYITFVY